MDEVKKISKRLFLKDTHPTMVKINKLYDLAEELGISFHFESGCCLVLDNDRDSNLPDLLLEDIEENHHVNSFPVVTEFKVVYDNPAYLAEQKRQYDARKIEGAARRAKLKEEEEIILKEQQRQKVEQARKEYERLKAQCG